MTKTFTSLATIVAFFVAFFGFVGFMLGIAAVETGALPVVEFGGESIISAKAFTEIVFLALSLNCALCAAMILRLLDRSTGIA